MADPLLVSLRQQAVFHAFVAVGVHLNTGERFYLLDGASELSFGGNKYVGNDPFWGSLARIEAVEEGIAVQAPQLRVALNSTEDAIPIISHPSNQQSPVFIWSGAVNPENGAVTTPELEFLGAINRSQRGLGHRSGTYELDLASHYEDFFMSAEGLRLNNQTHQKIWPGELGLEYVTDITREIPWGQETPRSIPTRETYSPPIPGTIVLRNRG